MRWIKNPILYEINTWVWLHELSARYGKKIMLDNVPKEEWDALGNLNVDAVWFMGVWERSPAGIAVANQNANLLQDFHRALSDFKPEDNVGSAYCVKHYEVAAQVGGRRGLAKARQELAARNVRLILDFVPNHVAPDHAWVTEHPEYFIRGSADDLQRAPTEFFDANGQIIANGRDPYFAPWQDVAQLNAFDPGLREAAIETVNSIAEQCDGMRCDMAMLLLNEIFARTWGQRAGAMPLAEYWGELIAKVKIEHPDVIFMAEAYWDLEWQLQQQGFDYCYDKRLYDRLEHDNANAVRGHVSGDLAYQEKLVRFIENHDEPRAAATFSPPKERAAAVVMATLPGAKLYYDKQFQGWKTRLPVFLARANVEPNDAKLEAFYRTLLEATHTELFQNGTWCLCELNGWRDNQTCQNMVAWSWERGDERAAVIVNLSETRSQARVQLPFENLGGHLWGLRDPINDTFFERAGAELQEDGLYVDLGAWEFHFFIFV